MKFTEAMIAWNPGTEQIMVVPWPDRAGWAHGLMMTAGACDADLHTLGEEARAALLFIHFNTIVVRDRVEPQAAHQAFLAIDEYRQRIAPDMPGAEDDRPARSTGEL